MEQLQNDCRINQMKYAVMVPIDGDYIYVTEIGKNSEDLTPVLHDTRESALESASIWGKFAKIVEYKEN